jgi:C-terminal processing protease CtpA/Prc
MSPERNGTASPKLCGLGIAFKPDKKGNLYVKRLIPGGPADTSKLIEVRSCHLHVGVMNFH